MIAKENYRFFNMQNFKSGVLAARKAEMDRLEALGLVPDLGPIEGEFEYTGEPMTGALSAGDGTVCYPLLAEQLVFLIELLSVAWVPWITASNGNPNGEGEPWYLGLLEVSPAGVSMSKPLVIKDSDYPISGFTIYGWRLPKDNDSGILIFHHDDNEHQGSSRALIGPNGYYDYDKDNRVACQITWGDIVKEFVTKISSRNAGAISIWGKLYSQKS